MEITVKRSRLLSPGKYDVLRISYENICCVWGWAYILNCILPFETSWNKKGIKKKSCCIKKFFIKGYIFLVLRNPHRRACAAGYRNVRSNWFHIIRRGQHQALVTFGCSSLSAIEINFYTTYPNLKNCKTYFMDYW